MRRCNGVDSSLAAKGSARPGRCLPPAACVDVLAGQRAKVLDMVAVGDSALPGDSGEESEPVIYLQVECPACDHHLDPEGAGFPQGLGDGLQPGRVRPEPVQRVDLVQDQQCRAAAATRDSTAAGGPGAASPSRVPARHGTHPAGPGGSPARPAGSRARAAAARPADLPGPGRAGRTSRPGSRGHGNHLRPAGCGKQVRDDSGGGAADLGQRDPVLRDPVPVTGGLVMDPVVDVLVSAPVGGMQPAPFPQVAPYLIGCQLRRQVIVEEVA